jgi:phosphoribosyl 1,2-cyclic phosphate phosphodiesterase
MKLTILGSGNAGGTPLFGCRCAACQRANLFMEHRRRSACALVETTTVRVLIDAGLAELGRRFPPGQLDAVLLTHYHVDHVQGLFPIRWGKDVQLPVIGPDDPNGCADLLTHPGILDFTQKADAFSPFELGDLEITPVPLQHSKPTLGYLLRHGDARIAYLTDTCGLAADVVDWLRAQAPDLMVLDCSQPPRERPPRNHNDLDLAIDIHEQVAPGRTLLTHIGHEFDTWLMEFADKLPAGVGPAADGTAIEIDAVRAPPRVIGNG